MCTRYDDSWNENLARNWRRLTQTRFRFRSLVMSSTPPSWPKTYDVTAIGECMSMMPERFTNDGATLTNMNPGKVAMSVWRHVKIVGKSSTVAIIHGNIVNVYARKHALLSHDHTCTSLVNTLSLYKTPGLHAEKKE